MPSPVISAHPLPGLTFILGGARSGKSALALAMAESAVADSDPAPGLVFLATAQAGDAEMAERIARHRNDRGPRWSALEAPLGLAAALSGIDKADQIVVVDCLTLWLSNLMHADCNPDLETANFLRALSDRADRVILVSNEVGLGIVPDNALARRFRDHAGRLHQTVAARADQVIFVAAGLPLRLK